MRQCRLYDFARMDGNRVDGAALHCFFSDDLQFGIHKNYAQLLDIRMAHGGTAVFEQRIGRADDRRFGRAQRLPGSTDGGGFNHLKHCQRIFLYAVNFQQSRSRRIDNAGKVVKFGNQLLARGLTSRRGMAIVRTSSNNS